MKKPLLHIMLTLGAALSASHAAPVSDKGAASSVIASTPAEFATRLPPKVYILLISSQERNAVTAAAIESLGPLRKTELALLPDDATRPKATSQAAPEYLRDADDGYAEVIAVITASGDIGKAYCFKASQRTFGERAVAAVAKWKFQPGRVHGETVPVLFVQRVEFTTETSTIHIR